MKAVGHIIYHPGIIAALISLTGGCLFYIFGSVKRLPEKKSLIEFIELDVDNYPIVTHIYTFHY